MFGYGKRVERSRWLEEGRDKRLFLCFCGDGGVILDSDFSYSGIRLYFL